VKQVLGLRFRRERQEEFDILSDLFALEKNNTRRTNILKPQVDFDWIFIPAFPREAMQIVPIFGYFDATKLNFVGGPSWRSQALGKQAQKWGDIFFVGDDVDPEDPKDMGFVNSFTGLFGRRPKLIEMTAYDAFTVVNKVLSGQDFSSRDDLGSAMRSKEKLVGLTGEWTLQDGIWIKSMTAFKLRKGKVEKLF
jgi:ABC-type branched-subunit amino acid transport system substrate-binding protein